MKKCFDSGSDIHIALLQIRSTPLGQCLPSSATLLFNFPVSGIMPIIDRPRINTSNDHEHTSLVNRPYRNEQGIDTSKNFVSLPIRSTVVVQGEDRGPWTHGTIEDKGDHNYHDRTYKICITKTGRIITGNRQHIKPAPLYVEHYLCSQLNKHTKIDPLNTILDHLDKHPLPSTIENTTTERPHNHCTSNDQTSIHNAQNNNKEQMEENNTNITLNNKDSNNKEAIIRTRY